MVRELRQPRRRLLGQDIDDFIASRAPAELAERLQHRVVGFLAAIPLHALAPGEAKIGHFGAGPALKLIDQRRLADAWLPRHEDDLPLPAQRFAQAVAQVGEDCVSSHQAAVGRLCLRSAMRLRTRADRRDETVSAARHGLDEARIPGIVSERLAHFQHVVLQNLGIDIRLGPQGAENLVLRHQPARVLHQVSKHVECLGGQRSALVLSRIPAAPQTQIDRVEPESRKLHDEHTVITSSATRQP